MSQRDQLKKARARKRGKIAIILIGLIAIYVWAISGIEFRGIQETAGPVTKNILKGFISPDWSYVYSPDGEDLIRGLLEPCYCHCRYFPVYYSCGSCRALGSQKFK